MLAANLNSFSGPVVRSDFFGHQPRNLALPIGPRARLDTAAMTLDLLEACFTPAG